MLQVLHRPSESTANVLFVHWVQIVVEEHVMQSLRNYVQGSQRDVVFKAYIFVMQLIQVVLSEHAPQLGI